MKQLQNDFTTPEQSQRLSKLGVPTDSANGILLHYAWAKENLDEKNWGAPLYLENNLPASQALDMYLTDQDEYDIAIPCWSVGRLIWILSNSQGWKPKCVSIPESAINKQIDFLVKSIETRVLLNKFYYWEDKPETLHEIAELVCNRKLRGFFILRNGRRIHSNELRRAEKNSPVTTHIYWLRTEKDDTSNMYDYDMENVYNKSLDVVDFSKWRNEL